MADHPIPAKAKALSDEERLARAESCYQIELRIKDSLRKGREALWKLAEALYEFDEESGWLALGYDTLEEWLAQSEIGMKRTNYYRLSSTWRQLVVQRQVSREDLAEIDVAKADIVLPAIKRGQKTLKEALGDAKALPMSDLRNVYYGEKDEKQPEPEPEPDPSEPGVPGNDDDRYVEPDDSPFEGTATDLPVDSNGHGDFPVDDELEQEGAHLGEQMADFLRELSEAKFWQPEAKKVPAEWRERLNGLLEQLKSTVS